MKTKTPEEKRAFRAVLAELEEKNPDGMDMCWLLVEALGLAYVCSKVEHAKLVHATVGMRREDGELRTLGGVFFRLVRVELGDEGFTRIVTTRVERQKARRQRWEEQKARNRGSVGPIYEHERQRMPERSANYRYSTREEKLAELGVGPWLDERDYEEWPGTGPMKGFVHIVVRGHMGNTCGYVGLPPGHPWHGKRWDDIDANVHGGLTYAEPCNDHICHVPAPGEPEHLWWIGFDCAHAFDYVPRLKQLCADLQPSLEYDEAGQPRAVYVEPPAGASWVDRYRTMDYAKQQTSLLAWQAAKVQRWIDYRAAQPDTRHEQHKVKAGIVLDLRVKQRSLQRLRRRRIQERKSARA